MARRLAYLVAAGLLAALALLAAAPAASAHATIVSTSPADGAVVAKPPARVTVTYDEAVGVSADSLRVFAPDGKQVDTGHTRTGSKPQQIVVGLRPGLGRGTYTVAWHVVSDDSHHVQGAFTFSVGAPSGTSVNPADLGPAGSAIVGVVFGVVRWLAFCSFALLAGAVAFVIWCWPAGATRRAVLRLTMGAWGGLALSVLAAVLLQGVYGAGKGIGHLFWPNVLHATLYSRYGRAIGVRLLLVIVALFAFSITLGGLEKASRRSRAIAGAGWGVLTAALAATWAVADHAGTGIQVPLAIPSDIIHLTAISTWLGGLAMLATIVLRRPGGPEGVRGATKRRNRAATAQAAQAVIRFSPIALSCVGAIVITGTYQAWRGVGTLGALFGTTYGRLLLAKIAGMCALIGLGYLARIRIAQILAPEAPQGAAEAAQPVQAASGAGTLLGQVKAAVIARSGQLRAVLAARPAPTRAQAAVAARPARAEAAVAGPPGQVKSTVATRARQANGRSGRQGQATGRARQTGQANGRNDWRRGANGRGPAKADAAAATALGGAEPDALPDPGRAVVTLTKLRWSVMIEALIAASILAVTAVLVNTPTARESFSPPASAAVALNTGGPGGHGSIAVTVSPARIGPNQISLSVTTSAGRPYRPQQIQAALYLPTRHLGPLAVPLTADSPGHYHGAPAAISTAGQWELRITIHSDAFDETTVTAPVTVH